MTSKVRVSIGLPVFNGERYLGQCLDAILAQTCADFELIISDNASTDATQAICEAYAARDPRVRYSRNPRNLGAAPNFNKTLLMSSAAYFKWAPYDDLIDPQFLERCVEVLDDREDVVLCYARAKIIDANGDFVSDYDPGPDTSAQSPSKRFANLILQPEYAVQIMGVIRKSHLLRTRLMGSFPCSDEVLLAHLSLLGRFHEIPDRLYSYRIHPQQSTLLYVAERARVEWFDTDFAGKVTLPKWSYLAACLDVIGQTPMPIAARCRCLAAVLRWSIRPAHLRALGKDLVLAASWLARGDGRVPGWVRRRTV